MFVSCEHAGQTLAAKIYPKINHNQDIVFAFKNCNSIFFLLTDIYYSEFENHSLEQFNEKTDIYFTCVYSL